MNISISANASSILLEQLGWTLVHFVWQGAAVAVLYACCLIVLRGRAPQSKYVVGCTALAVMAICPIVTYMQLAQGANISKAVVKTATLDSTKLLPMSTDIQTSLPSITPAITDAPSDAPLIERSWGTLAPVQRQFTASEQGWSRLQRRIAPKLSQLVEFWLVGVVLLTLRFVIGCQRVWCLSRQTVQVVPECWRIRLDRLSVALGVTRSVRLIESALVEVPTVVGWLRPMILLPAAALTGLPASQLEALLAHELAHIRRHDFIVNIAQTLIETVLFYHPAVWWISGRIRADRELCCDDLAVTVCSTRVELARALAAMEALRAAPIFVVAANGGSLRNRVRRLVNPSRDLPGSGGWLASFTLISLITVTSLVSWSAARSAIEEVEKKNLQPQNSISQQAEKSRSSQLDQQNPGEGTNVANREEPDNLAISSDSKPELGHFRGSIRLTGAIPPKKVLVAGGGAPIQGLAIPSDIWDDSLLIDGPRDPELGMGRATMGIANVYVYLRQAPAEVVSDAQEKLRPIQLKLINATLNPRAQLWRVGQPLDLVNGETAATDFKLNTLRNASMNLLVRPGQTMRIAAPTKSERFPILFESSVFNWLRSSVLILDHPYAAITNARGEFEIPDLPAGAYEFTIWHESGILQKNFKVTLAAGQINSVDLSFEYQAEKWRLTKTERTETEITAIPPEVQQQVQKAAAAFKAARGNLAARRPAALRGLRFDDPRVAEISRQAVIDLAADDAKSSDAAQILAYLAELADDDVIAGTRSENGRIAARCCSLLMHRGPTVVAALIAALQHDDESVRSSAAISLGESGRPAAVQPLIDLLAREKNPVSIIFALEALQDKRAIEPLRKHIAQPGYGHVAQQAIARLENPESYEAWPLESLPDRLICRNAATWRGELYGRPELDHLIELLNSANANIASEAALFLGKLHADAAVPALSRKWFGYSEIALTEIASTAAIDELFRRLHTPNPSLRNTTVSSLSSGNRWSVPILIALLDDPTLRQEAPPSLMGEKWPISHRAHSALWQLFRELGDRGRMVNLANEPAPNIEIEIDQLKVWWKEHGDDYLAGKEVPVPELTSVWFSR